MKTSGQQYSCCWPGGAGLGEKHHQLGHNHAIDKWHFLKAHRNLSFLSACSPVVLREQTCRPVFKSLRLSLASVSTHCFCLSARGNALASLLSWCEGAWTLQVS